MEVAVPPIAYEGYHIFLSHVWGTGACRWCNEPALKLSNLAAWLPVDTSFETAVQCSRLRRPRSDAHHQVTVARTDPRAGLLPRRRRFATALILSFPRAATAAHSQTLHAPRQTSRLCRISRATSMRRRMSSSVRWQSLNSCVPHTSKAFACFDTRVA